MSNVMSYEYDSPAASKNEARTRMGNVLIACRPDWRQADGFEAAQSRLLASSASMSRALSMYVRAFLA